MIQPFSLARTSASWETCPHRGWSSRSLSLALRKGVSGVRAARSPDGHYRSRSHGRDFAGRPSESALTASVAVRFPQPIVWRRVLSVVASLSLRKFGSCVAGQDISVHRGSRPDLATGFSGSTPVNTDQPRHAHQSAADRAPLQRFIRLSRRVAHGHACSHSRLAARSVAHQSLRPTGGESIFYRSKPSTSSFIVR